MDVLEINKEVLNALYEQAAETERMRKNYDLRTSTADGSQRMLNALLPAIHDTDTNIFNLSKAWISAGQT